MSGGGEGSRISYRDVDRVHTCVERCLMRYMTKREAKETLLVQENIDPIFTQLIWERLERENPDFFRTYYLRVVAKGQIMEFNKMIAQQIHLMQELGVIDNTAMLPSNGSQVSLTQQVPAPLVAQNDRLRLGGNMNVQPQSVFNNYEIQPYIQGTIDRSFAGRDFDGLVYPHSSNVGLAQGVNGEIELGQWVDEPMRLDPPMIRNTEMRLAPAMNMTMRSHDLNPNMTMRSVPTMNGRVGTPRMMNSDTGSALTRNMTMGTAPTINREMGLAPTIHGNPGSPQMMTGITGSAQMMTGITGSAQMINRNTGPPQMINERTGSAQMINWNTRPPQMMNGIRGSGQMINRNTGSPQMMNGIRGSDLMINRNTGSPQMMNEARTMNGNNAKTDASYIGRSSLGLYCTRTGDACTPCSSNVEPLHNTDLDELLSSLDGLSAMPTDKNDFEDPEGDVKMLGPAPENQP